MNLTCDTETKTALDKYRLYWRIENGDLPEVAVGINLQRKEKCYTTCSAGWYEEKRATSTLEAFMLTPIGTPLLQDLQHRGRHILDTLQGLPLEQQLDLACRTILAVLLMSQPDRSAPKAKRDAFKVICDGVRVWLKDEIAKMRRTKPLSKKTVTKPKPPQKVGHAEVDTHTHGRSRQ